MFFHTIRKGYIEADELLLVKQLAIILENIPDIEAGQDERGKLSGSFMSHDCQSYS